MDKDLEIKQLEDEKDQLASELASLKAKLQEKENEGIILESRSLVRAQHTNHTNGEMWDINSLPFYNLVNFKLKLGWKIPNGDLIKKDQTIVDIELIASGSGVNKIMSIESNTDGKLFILKEDQAEEGQVIAVVSDPTDNIEDIKEWLELEGYLN